MCGQKVKGRLWYTEKSKKDLIKKNNVSEFWEVHQLELSGSSNEDSKMSRGHYYSRIRSHECIRNMFLVSLDRLEDSGWYWGKMTTNEAVTLLKSTDVGTFLLRDSSDSRYFFSLSVRLPSSITNIRVLFTQGKFMFECFGTEYWETPKFDCVVKLICYYAAVSKSQDNRALCARSDVGDSLLTLEKPLFRKVPTLQHLARRVLNKTLTTEQQSDLCLGKSVETFMSKYPFSI